MFWTTTRRSQPQICRILLRITFFPSRVIWKQQRLVGFYAACFEVRPRLHEGSWIEKVSFFFSLFLGRWHIHVLVPDRIISVVIFFKREEDKESTNGLATFVFLLFVCHFAGCLRYQLWTFNALFAAHSAKFIQSWKSRNAAV